jgi:3',5'-cyclic AMP phosphodiesterase CpdA
MRPYALSIPWAAAQLAVLVACSGERSLLPVPEQSVARNAAVPSAQASTVPGADADAAVPQDASADDLENHCLAIDGAPGAATSSRADIPKLVGAPLIFAPTQHGFGLNVVTTARASWELELCVRPRGGTEWTGTAAPVLPTDDIAQWSVDGLDAGTRYEYQVSAVRGSELARLYSGRVTTQRKPGTRFTFAILADSHITPREDLPEDVTPQDSMEATLSAVAQDIGASNPDFMIHLGDMLDFHRFGFNDPPPDGSWTRLGYLNYRRLLADTLGNASHFAVIGNWEGENGCYTAEELFRSRDQRVLYLPGPTPATYPEGGSYAEDYYAFTWGDALFVVLNVMSYTSTPHLLSDAELPDDWTLGKTQLTWLENTLKAATSRWRLLFIHHTVGGAAGNAANSNYGRGGGQAAYVGEQATVHELMRKHGVQIFFYGHDHVFTDMEVDGIHYTLPGSAGAPWKFGTSETGYTDYWPDSGYGRVDVSPTSVRVEFIAQGGALLYSYTVD